MKPFDQVVREHGATVLRVCRSAVGPTDADDVWSETFLAALRAYPRLTEGANVEAWLVTIARNKATDVLRARARAAFPVAEVPDGGVEDAPADALTPELGRALTALTPRQRQSVVYHHVVGLAHAEVAELIGGTPAAVRRASADGIRSLRGALATEEGR